MEQLELLKEIPGYKAILKSVIKSQIQILLEQLSNHTGEESIILTASLSEGTLSHLGSTMGKGFLEGRDEIKSHFLAYCLRSQQRRSMPEPRTPFQEQCDDAESTAKRQKIADPFVVPNQEVNRRTSADSFVIPNQDNHNVTNTVTMPMLSPQHNFTPSPNSETTLETQAGRPFNITPDESRTDFAKVEPPQTDSNMSASDSNMSIKLEPVGEGELDLEITGVELGSVGPMLGSGSFGAGLCPGAGPGQGPVGSVAPSGAEGFHGDWGQGTSGGYPLADSGDSTLNQSGSQYNDQSNSAKEMITEYIKTVREQNLKTCNLCGRSFKNKYKLERHLKTHSTEKDEVCQYCHKAFNRKDHLKKHIDTKHLKTREIM